MIRTDSVIVVEGKYDRIALSRVVEGVIVETGGFGIFTDGEKLATLRTLARERGLILLTDSDRSGMAIRNYLIGAIGAEYVKNAYIPDVYGKERRKRHPSAEGKLGVEGMSREIILESLRRAGATIEGEVTAAAGHQITKADLMDLGLYGPGSNENRIRLIKTLGFPEKMSMNGFLQAVNLLYSLDELKEILEKYNG